MLVKELIKELLEMDQELEVWTAKDPEGNGYNPLYYSPTVMYTYKDDEDFIDGSNMIGAQEVDDEEFGIPLDERKAVVVL